MSSVLPCDYRVRNLEAPNRSERWVHRLRKGFGESQTGQTYACLTKPTFPSLSKKRDKNLSTFFWEISLRPQTHLATKYQNGKAVGCLHHLCSLFQRSRGFHHWLNSLDSVECKKGKSSRRKKLLPTLINVKIFVSVVDSSVSNSFHLLFSCSLCVCLFFVSYVFCFVCWLDLILLKNKTSVVCVAFSCIHSINLILYDWWQSSNVAKHGCIFKPCPLPNVHTPFWHFHFLGIEQIFGCSFLNISPVPKCPSIWQVHLRSIALFYHLHCRRGLVMTRLHLIQFSKQITDSCPGFVPGV